MGSEPPQPIKPSAELAVERGPPDLDVLLHGVESIGEPYIHVDDHGPWPDGPECRLADRNRMLPKRAVEVLVQQNPILPKGWLVGVYHVRHGDLGLHEPPSALD